VLCPNSRIANLFYYQSGFRRDYSNRRPVEHPIGFTGGLHEGLTAFWFTGRLCEGLTALWFHRWPLRGADCIVFQVNVI